MQGGDIIADRFVIEREAGIGGMSTVYRAHDKQTGRAVALKILAGADPRHHERFAREAQLLADLRHPGIVSYVAHGAGSGILYIAMEWLDGEDLSNRLMSRGMTVPECVTVIANVAEALAYAHQKGIVHRDIKPSNLFLADGQIERIKVLDFGIARLGTTDMTQAGMRLGTPAYMSPEQARGMPKIEARSDVFSLGAVLFECLTGRKAFPGDDAMAVLAKILLEQPPRVGELRWDVPPALDQLVGRMLAKDPASRPADGAAVVAELAKLGPVAGTSRVPIVGAPDALTAGERRLLCVILVKDGRKDPAALADMDIAVTAANGHLESLSDGSVVITLTGQGAATDLATRAARCALQVRAAVPDVAMALATGRGVVSGSLPMGEVIDRAVRVLRGAVDRDHTLKIPPEGAEEPVPAPRGEARRGLPAEGRSPLNDRRSIRLDDITAGLLDTRFEVGGDQHGLELRGEQERGEVARTLFGKETQTVARDAEMATLAAVYMACVTERSSRAVLVTSAAGVGKSRLRYDLLRWLKQRGDSVEIWLGRGDPMSAGAPFGLLGDAIRRGIGVVEGEPVGVRRQKVRARVARWVAESEVERVAAFVGELVGTPFPDDDDGNVQLRAARQDPILMGDQMRRALEDWLGAECAAQPLVIVIEDLHWGDVPTVKFVDAALRHLRDAPFLVLAFARPDVHDLFPKLWSERDLQEIRLSELPRKAAERLVRQVLGDQLTPERVTMLVERAAGNAFYLEELMRAVVEGKGEALPETVLAMVQARIERLETEARRVLRAASVYGQVFWEGGVRALLGGAERTAQVSEWLRELSAREVISARPDCKFEGEREYAFRHGLVREAAYAMLTDADRALGHRLAGEWLEKAGEIEAVVLAEHLERGGDSARAVGWYQKAALQALGGNDLAATLLRAERGLTALGAATGPGVDERMGELRLIQSEAHRWRAEFPASERAALDAMAKLRRGTATWYEAAEMLAFSSGSLGHQEILLDLFATYADLDAARTPPSAPMISAKTRLAAQLLHAGRTELSDALRAQIDAVAAPFEARDPAISGKVSSLRALRVFFGGNPGEYLSESLRCVQSFERAGDQRNATQHRGSMGYAALEIGDYGKAIQMLREVKATAERMGLFNVVATAHQNLGLALGCAGQYDEGRVLEARAVKLFSESGNRRMHAASLYYLAWIRVQSGELRTAEEEARAAIEIASAAPPVLPVRAEGLGILATILLAKGRPAEALQVAEESMGILHAMGGIDGGEFLIRLVHAESLEAVGRHADACASIKDARERLLLLAEKMTDPAIRKSFVSNVAVNARIVDLAAQWL